MSASLNPSPITLGLLGVAALYLIGRRNAAAAAQVPAASGLQRYATPTQVAAQLGSLVALITKGVNAQTPSNTNVTPDAPTGTSRDGSQGLFGWSVDKAFSGGPLASGGGFGGALDSWSLPGFSFVNPGATSKAGAITDSTVTAPVYTLTDDFTNNPWLVAAP